ncbi:MAG: penicillin acylase family protein, partial [Pseudomonadota bacterium]
ESGITTRTEEIKVRWWFDETVDVRDTDYGPIISDLDMVKTDEKLSLRWVGHRPSDELTAWLQASRAQNWDEFRMAMRDYALTPLNIVYADKQGHIGLLTGTSLPKRPLERPDDIIQQPDGPNDWSKLLTPDDLPVIFDPPAGFIASANNPPAPADVPIGYFFAPSDRIDRLNTILQDRSADPISVDDLSVLQTDTYSRRAHDLSRLMVQKIDAAIASGWTIPMGGEDVRAVLSRWDGKYEADSQDALIAEAFLVSLFETYFDEEQTAIITALGRARESARPQLVAASPESLIPAIETAFDAALEARDEFGTWGGMHRLRLGHPLARLPLVGGKFVYLDLPVGGSSQTVMKTAHSPTLEQHRTTFGSNARHVSDMADRDANYFVLLGGQDGVINSDTSVDQVPLWRSREFIRMPLTQRLVRQEFPRAMSLTPDR